MTPSHSLTDFILSILSSTYPFFHFTLLSPLFFLTTSRGLNGGCFLPPYKHIWETNLPLYYTPLRFNPRPLPFLIACDGGGQRGVHTPLKFKLGTPPFPFFHPIKVSHSLANRCARQCPLSHWQIPVHLHFYFLNFHFSLSYYY